MEENFTARVAIWSYSTPRADTFYFLPLDARVLAAQLFCWAENKRDRIYNPNQSFTLYGVLRCPNCHQNLELESVSGTEFRVDFSETGVDFGGLIFIEEEYVKLVATALFSMAEEVTRAMAK